VDACFSQTRAGLYVSEIGRLHATVMMWAYDSLADRESPRKAMEADPDWQKFIRDVFALDAILSQDAMIMSSAPFSSGVAWTGRRGRRGPGVFFGASPFRERHNRGRAR
jgi:hypothetical protein